MQMNSQHSGLASSLWECKCEAFEYCTGGWPELQRWCFHPGTDVFGGCLLPALSQGTPVSEKPWSCSLFCAVGTNSQQWKRNRRYHWTHRMVGMKAKSRWKSPVWAVNAALGTSVCQEAEVGRDLWDCYVLPHLPHTGGTVAFLPSPCLLPSERSGVYCVKRPLLLQLCLAQYPAHSIGTWYTRLSKERNQ